MLRLLLSESYMRNTLRGFISIRIVEHDLQIFDCTLHEQDGKRWIGLPGRVQLDRENKAILDDTGKPKYVSVLKFASRLASDAFQAAVLGGTGSGSAGGMIDARRLARALGGDVAGRNKVSAPGPGHSKGDRSLSILIKADAPDGFVVKSFGGDSWQDCRDLVRKALGIGEWRAFGYSEQQAAEKGSEASADEQSRAEHLA